VRLLLDENVNPAVAAGLRDRGHDVVAVTEDADLRSRSDEALFEWCQQEERTIVTYDRDDFIALDSRYKADGKDHAGIIILNVEAFPQRASTIGRLVRSLEGRIHGGPPYPGFVHWLA